MMKPSQGQESQYYYSPKQKKKERKWVTISHFKLSFRNCNVNEFKLSIGGKISDDIPKNSSSLGIEFQGWIIG
jgi:hypothetical protein